MGVLVDFPTTAEVGDSGLDATFTVVNISTGGERMGSVTVTDMTLVPSCSTFDPGCDAPGSVADPGTFALSPTGVGAPGTACEAKAFTFTVINPSTGQVRLTPADGVAPVLGPPTVRDDLDVCTITFTISVLKQPNHDTLPASAGASTNQLAFASGTHPSGQSVSATNSDVTTVHGGGAATPTLATMASPSAVVGGQISDTATLSGGQNPTGTLTFRLFGPDDVSCSGTPVFTDTAGVSGNGDYMSDPFMPTEAGTYRWVVDYSGDANNLSATSPCNSPNESTTVTRQDDSLIGAVLRLVLELLGLLDPGNAGMGGVL